MIDLTIEQDVAGITIVAPERLNALDTTALKDLDMAVADAESAGLRALVLRGEGRPVGDATVLAVLDALRRDVVGAGPLEELVRLDGVTDVVVNGPDEVFLDRGRGLERTAVTFPDDAAVRRLAKGAS